MWGNVENVLAAQMFVVALPLVGLLCSIAVWLYRMWYSNVYTKGYIKAYKDAMDEVPVLRLRPCGICGARGDQPCDAGLHG